MELSENNCYNFFRKKPRNENGFKLVAVICRQFLSLLTDLPIVHILNIYSKRSTKQHPAMPKNRRHRGETYRPEVMPKMNIHISLQSDIPTYEQIKIQIKAQILDGRLAPNQPLTSMRQLARDLRVSIITTTRAYSDLEAEGLIYTVQGRGCFVKGDAEMVRRQYLQNIDEAFRTAVEKGKAAGLNLAELQDRLEEIFHEKCN